MGIFWFTLAGVVALTMSVILVCLLLWDHNEGLDSQDGLLTHIMLSATSILLVALFFVLPGLVAEAIIYIRT